MSKFKSILALGVLAAACGFSSAVTKADTIVNYTTTGKFTSDSSNSITNGGITITFNGANVPGLDLMTSLGNMSDSSLGTFVVSDPGSLPGNFTDSFTLTVTQTVPAPGGAQSFGIGTVSGILTFNASSADVVFTSPLTLTIAGSPPITYQILNADHGTPGDVSLEPLVSGGTTTVNGLVSAATVPVPAAAWTGLSMLVGMAGFGLLRKRANLA